MIRWLAGVLRSFRHAFRGVAELFLTQRNSKAHLIASVVAVGLGAWCRLTAAEWRWIVACLAAVWAAEAFNSAIEFLADRVTRETDPLIRQAKDLAAAGVLFVSIGAAVIGLSVFWPHLAAR